MHAHTHTHTHKSKKTMSVYMKIQECFWILKKMKTKTAWVWEILSCPDQTSTSSWDSWISHLCKRGSTALFQGDLVSCETIKNFVATVVSLSMLAPTDVVLGELFFFTFIFISWRIIILQYCSGFCHTLTWISHGFTCVPHPDPWRASWRKNWKSYAPPALKCYYAIKWRTSHMPSERCQQFTMTYSSYNPNC